MVTYKTYHIAQFFKGENFDINVALKLEIKENLVLITKISLNWENHLASKFLPLKNFISYGMCILYVNAVAHIVRRLGNIL